MGILSNLGSKLKQGGRFVQYKLQVNRDRKSVKYDILDLFTLEEVKKMCSFYDVGKPDPKDFNSRGEIVHVKPDKRDWINHAMYNVSLEDMKEYAKKRRKNLKAVIEKENRLKSLRTEKYPEYEKDYYDTVSTNGSSDGADSEFSLASQITDAIESFEPARTYKNEFPYQIELNGYLKAHFPNIDIEPQKGRSRPDIAIEERIAIEVKGPTKTRDLTTIADKCLRYLQYYDHLIIVLFETQVNEMRYSEWYEGMIRNHGDEITIIRK